MKKTLVIGASPNPSRYAYIATMRLQEKGYPVEAYGLREGTIGEVPITTELKQFKDIHTVTLYVGPKHQASYFDYVLSLHPKRVIFNPGTENPVFYELLKENGIAYEASCTLVLLATNQY